MAREHSRVNITIWQDPEWRQLPAPAQHLYLTLWTHPGLSYCGVVDWRPGRIAAMSGGTTTEQINESADCLQARLFIVVDEDTEECLIRSWARFDGLLKQPRMAVSYANAYAEVASNDLRGVIVHETKKIRGLDPGLAGWAKPQVKSMLDLPSLDPRSRALPKDPFGDGFGYGFAPRLGQTDPKVSPSVSVPPTPAPAPAPNTPAPNNTAPTPSTPRRGTRIPDDFTLTDEMRQWASEKGYRIDLDTLTEEFVDYWSALPGAKATKLDWGKTWKNRVREVATRRGNVRPISGGSQLSTAPSALPGETEDQRRRRLRIPEGW